MPQSSVSPTVSVLMPVFNGVRWIRRALESLQARTLTTWEAIVVDDGSTDDPAALCAIDPRVRLTRWERNRGMGAALNAALDDARAPFVAYLPADDVYYADHLQSLLATLPRAEDAVVAYSGVRHHYNRWADGQIEESPLQTVQVMHRHGPERWVERTEFVTDDLERMFWCRLRGRGAFRPTGQITCEWVDHPEQRHKIIQEPLGGINPYRVRYGTVGPLRFRSSTGNPTDEVDLYRRFYERPDTPVAEDGLTILLVGELAYNAERVLALEELGHRLYGLWMPEPYWYNAVGPLPFGHVQDISYAGWREAVRALKPDVIYAGLNWQAVPFAHTILRENPGIPFVWHFKEGPFICLEKGMWPQLVDLYTQAQGQIYCSPEMRDWFATVLPATAVDNALVLDGDLPKREWLQADPSPRLSQGDGSIHTVVAGRPIGLRPQSVAALAADDIHLHFYGDFTRGQWRTWIETAQSMAPNHLHLHPNVDQRHWVREFSQYDAGWLHCFPSRNGGELRRADWDDLNYPARIATKAAAGLPMIQSDNSGAVVATQTLARPMDIGLFFSDFPDLAAQLRDTARMDELRANVGRQRDQFSFDYHADRLVDYLRRATGEGGAGPGTSSVRS